MTALNHAEPRKRYVGTEAKHQTKKEQNRDARDENNTSNT